MNNSFWSLRRLVFINLLYLILSVDATSVAKTFEITVVDRTTSEKKVYVPSGDTFDIPYEMPVGHGPLKNTYKCQFEKHKGDVAYIFCSDEVFSSIASSVICDHFSDVTDLRIFERTNEKYIIMLTCK